MTVTSITGWLRAVLAGLFLIAGGASLPVAALDLNSSASSPPGVLVDIGTHRLHLYCRGEGEPSVIMDAGLGGFSLEWAAAQESLARRARTCLYDRAGYGWSDPGPGPRTSSRIVDELYLLLNTAGVPAPYVLVGHSFGGYNMQLFAKRYPYLTAGIVLVDSSNPDQVERFLAPPLNLNTAPSRRQGIVQYSGFTIPEHLPDVVRELLYQVGYTPKARAAMTDEYLSFRDSADQVRAAGPLPDVPLVVLTRGRIGERRMPLPERQQLIEGLWMQLQSELAEASPHSAHLIAELSGHHVHLDQPALVVDSVAMVSDFARDHLIGEEPAVAESWLAFSNATWRLDRLHPNLQLDAEAVAPQLAGFEPYMRAGHFTGTARPAFQQVVYFQPASLDGCELPLPVGTCDN